MSLKYKVETLDGIDETAQSFYTEAESGGYVLKVEGVVPQDKFAEVNQKAIDNATEAARRRKTLERVTGKLGLETADGLDEALDALLSGKGKSGDNEAIVAQIKADYEAKLKDAQSKYTGVKIDAALSETKAALQAAGFPAKVADMLAKTNRDRLNLDEAGNVRILSDNGNPLAGSGADGYATFGDLANELAASMPELLVDKGKGGSGKPPASGSSGGVTPKAWGEAKSAREKAALLKSKLNK